MSEISRTRHIRVGVSSESEGQGNVQTTSTAADGRSIFWGQDKWSVRILLPSKVGFAVSKLLQPKMSKP